MFIFSLLLALTPATLYATTVHRCEDVNGHITFTHLGCSTDQQLYLQAADNPPPGSSAPPLPTQQPGKTAKAPKADQARSAVAGTAERQDGCGNQVTASERRKAMIAKEVKTGMTQADVQSMLGKPDSISSQNGKVRFSYVDKHSGRKRTVAFDSNGCVKP